jgi:hypothetical protein
LITNPAPVGLADARWAGCARPCVDSVPLVPPSAWLHRECPQHHCGRRVPGPGGERLASATLGVTVAYNYADNDGGGLWTPLDSPLYPLVHNSLFDLNALGGSMPDVFGTVQDTHFNWMTSTTTAG